MDKARLERDSNLQRAGTHLPERPYVFGRRGLAPFSGWSRSKERLDARITEQRAEQRLGRPLREGERPKPKDFLPAWHLHDLRRSAVTHMADREELAIEPHIIEACINHASGHKGGVAGIYNRAAYREQKRIALQRWANWSRESGNRRAENI
jgi:hypothetical protein